MNEKDTYTISTNALCYVLNSHRKSNYLTEIDNTLIASKIGILFALKTNGYVNFKDEQIELNDAQIMALEEILNQHFNVDMTDGIHALLGNQERWQENMAPRNFCTPMSSQATVPNGFFNKIKGFLKTKSNTLEKLA